MRQARFTWIALCVLLGALLFPSYAAASPLPRVSHLYSVESGPYSHPDQVELEWTDNAAVTAIAVHEPSGLVAHYQRIQGLGQYQPPGTYRYCITPSSATATGHTHCIRVTVPS
jgi:hypothetical protein